MKTSMKAFSAENLKGKKFLILGEPASRPELLDQLCRMIKMWTEAAYITLCMSSLPLVKYFLFIICKESGVLLNRTLDGCSLC